MPYIKLGKTDIKYVSTWTDTMIVSDIVDSQCSYKEPVLVRDQDTLDIYFGRQFGQRDYYNELLRQGVTLLLYKPLPGQARTEKSGYIDLSLYHSDSKLYESPEELPEIGEEFVKYLISDGTEYIWDVKEGYWIDIARLDQNLPDPENWTEWTNRDTLRLLKDEENLGFNYTYPKYPWTDEYTEEIDSQIVLDSMKETGMKGIDGEYETFSQILDFSGVKNFYSPSGRAYYFVIPDPESDLNYMIWYERNDLQDEVAPVGGDFIGGNSVSIKLVNPGTLEQYTRLQTLTETRSLIMSLGFKIVDLGPERWEIYTSRKGKNTYFYETPGMAIEPAWPVTYNIISKATEPFKVIEFYSKTIGPSENRIKIRTEKLSEGWRVTVSRYDWSEVHEESTLGLLEIAINRDSKLIETRLFDKSATEIPIGEWKMGRAQIGNPEAKDYWKSLDIMKELNISEDFFLVPDPSVWIRSGLSPDYGWYVEYEELCDYAKSKNCQVLIGNNDTGYSFSEVKELPTKPEEKVVYSIVDPDGGTRYWLWKDKEWVDVSGDREIVNPWLNSFIYNWTGDLENRLVYFYREMDILGHHRPAYYIFLRGIITDVYSETMSNILYYPPVVDAYLDGDLTETKLESKKSNYMVDNNILYYYKKYFNHTGSGKYDSTILTRFCISKVSREIQNKRWKLLSTRMNGEQREILSGILKSIEEQYSIIKYIILGEMNYDYAASSLEITLDMYVSELLDKNITLSVTLNYIN